MSYTKIEQEIVVLKAVWEMISGMVNYEMFAKPTRTTDTNLVFNLPIHMRLFNILLLDFLSSPNPWPFELPSTQNRNMQSERSILFHLKNICADPVFEPEDINTLQSPVESFMQWLEEDCVVEKVWFPSIELEASLKIKRLAFIRICGNIAKHNFTRLRINVRDIRRLLESNDIRISEEEGYLVLPEFYEWFHSDIFSYHSSTIAEFLNNIIWGIYKYLQAEFHDSYDRPDPLEPYYKYRYPPNCEHPVIRSMYWDLMNCIRSGPYLPPFEVSRFFKMRY